MGMGLTELFEAEKRIRPVPAWREDNGSFRWKAPLVVGGAAVEGFTLHARATVSEPGRDVSFILERAETGQPSMRLDRLDWNPLHNHSNRGLGPQELRFKVIEGHHRHSYYEKLTDDGVLRTGNLPIAVPISQSLITFQSFVDFAAETYKVQDLRFLLPPPWSEDLFGQ